MGMQNQSSKLKRDIEDAGACGLRATFHMLHDAKKLRLDSLLNS